MRIWILWVARTTCLSGSRSDKRFQSRSRFWRKPGLLWSLSRLRRLDKQVVQATLGWFHRVSLFRIREQRQDPILGRAASDVDVTIAVDEDVHFAPDSEFIEVDPRLD